MCRLPSQAEPSNTPFPITDLSTPVSYHCAIQPSTINPDMSVLSSSAPNQGKLYGCSLDQPILPLGLSVSFFNCYFAFTTHDTFSLCFSFEIPPLLVFFSFLLHTDTPWALILFNFGCWLAFGCFNSVSLWSRMAGSVSHRCFFPFFFLFSFLYCD